eukprot:g2728.t1
MDQATGRVIFQGAAGQYLETDSSTGAVNATFTDPLIGCKAPAGCLVHLTAQSFASGAGRRLWGFSKITNTISGWFSKPPAAVVKDPIVVEPEYRNCWLGFSSLCCTTKCRGACGSANMKHVVKCGVWGPDEETCEPTKAAPSTALCKDSTSKDLATCNKVFPVYQGKCQPGWGDKPSFPACKACGNPTASSAADCWAPYYRDADSKCFAYDHKDQGWFQQSGAWRKTGAEVPLSKHMYNYQEVKDVEGKLGGSLGSNFADFGRAFQSALSNWRGFGQFWTDISDAAQGVTWFGIAYTASAGSGYMFPYMNFVRGFQQPGFWAWVDSVNPFTVNIQGQPKWMAPVPGEKIGIISYQDYAKKHFDRTRWSEPRFDFFNDFYTGEGVPSWEDNDNHEDGIRILDNGMKLSGNDAIELLYTMEPRFEFDNDALTEATWNGFKYMGPKDIKYASNGVHGIKVVDDLLAEHNTRDTLGVLMMESVFSAHLVYDAALDEFTVDLSDMEKFKPLPNYAKMGGKATFKWETPATNPKISTNRLVTKSILYNGVSYTPTDDNAVVNKAFSESKLVGWKYAEKAFIASLLGMTNLVVHVKDLHLELAATFQVVTVDGFAKNPTHPVRRLLDQFVHRSVQATNDNFKLLFQYRAAEFSLAPLDTDEQLKLIDESIKTRPLNLAALDMTNFGTVRNMKAEFSTSDGNGKAKNGKFFWKWHYRALTVQQKLDDLIDCWFNKNYPSGYTDAEIAGDTLLNEWWDLMVSHLPALQRAIDPTKPGYRADLSTWATKSKPTREQLKNVMRTLMVWVSWIHEDVGHSAAAYVYNPVHTPMCVPEDGVGVPLASFAFNAAAYRGFVFLHRATMLESPADHWFDDSKGDRQCYTDFQNALKKLGGLDGSAGDKAFSDCDANGFYSCVDRVETAVSS